MAAETRNYNPRKVTATWVTATGTVDLADGVINDADWLTTARDTPRWSRENDNAGGATRVKNNNRGGTVSITFSASSPTNDILSARVELDDVAENQVGALVVRDLSGTTLMQADGAYLEDIPDLSFGAGRGQRTWVWQCAAMRRFAGSHNLV
jgi:hypothetical protein